jgi:hypothetical protein
MASVENTTVRMMTITDAVSKVGMGMLDPIRVFFENIAPGKGRVTITCFNEAWVAYWGAMGERYTVESFFVGNSPDYLVESLLEGMNRRYLKQHVSLQKRHVGQVVLAIQDALHREFSHLKAGRMVKSL